MNHLLQITKELSNHHLDALLITSEPGEYYALGFHGEGLVLVTRNKSYYSTDSRYLEAAASIEHVELCPVTPGHDHLTLAADRIRALDIRSLGFEENAVSFAMYQALKKVLPPQTTLSPASGLLSSLRETKDEAELLLMKKAQEITDRAFTEILNDIRPGVKETELAARLTYLQMKYGAQKNSFDPIVASGANGSKPHAIPTKKEIRTGEFVTMDFGCVYQGYCSDMTRTVCVGTPNAEMEKVYYTVLEAQKAGIAAARAGVSGKDIHNAAASVIEKAGYGEYFGHGFGHSLGIEIHEAPNANLRNPFPMPFHAVVSAEPGIYLPGRFGVRIEDVLVYEKDGCLDITASPKNLICL